MTPTLQSLGMVRISATKIWFSPFAKRSSRNSRAMEEPDRVRRGTKGNLENLIEQDSEERGENADEVELVPAVAEVGPAQDVELHRGFDEEDPREHVVYNQGGGVSHEAQRGSCFDAHDAGVQHDAHHDESLEFAVMDDEEEYAALEGQVLQVGHPEERLPRAERSFPGHPARL